MTGGGAWTEPEWPSSGRSEGKDARLPGSGGALASRPCAKTHPTRNQGPDDARIRRRSWGVRGRGIEVKSYPQRANSPGADRDLGAGWGRQRGRAMSQETGADAGTRRGSQRWAAEAGGWWVRATSRWADLRTERWGWERVKNERSSKMNGYSWGGVRKEGETNESENGKIKSGTEGPV